MPHYHNQIYLFRTRSGLNIVIVFSFIPAFQVTIIIYLSVVGALLLYMLFLLLVEPLIRRRDSYRQPLQNEDDSEVQALAATV